MRRHVTALVGLAGAALLAAGSVHAAPAAPAAPGTAAAREIRLAPGATATEVRGKLQGSADATYRLQAAAGQTLTVELASAQPSLQFNVLAPGTQEAMFMGSVSGPRAQVVLPDDGSYRIVVFLVRSAARRAESGAFTLKVSITGRPLPPLAAGSDAKVAGTRFHATAQVPCRPPYASADARCDAGVVRRGRDGTATVELRGANGLLRRLLFVGGKPGASDSAQTLGTQREGDTTRVTVGDSERYDIPDALIGGS